MQSQVHQLSKEELEEFHKIRDNCIHENEREALKASLNYYLNYRDQVKHIPSDKIALALKCSYFMAEKSQFTLDMNNKQIRGISFSLNNLLKEHKLDDTMLMLKQIYRKVNMDKDTNAYLSNVVKEISSLITFHAKLEKTLQKIDLKDNTDSFSYSKLFSSFVWLLFIDCKNKLLDKSTELLPNTYMLAHIVCSMIYLSMEYIQSDVIKGWLQEPGYVKAKEKEKELMQVIKANVSYMFCIKDFSEYVSIAKKFEAHLEWMIEKNILKCSANKIDILSPENININYKKLDKYYEKNFDPNELDERIFFRERALNLTPSKFTPFARQGYVNKFQKPAIGNKLSSGNLNKDNHFNHFSSHRILNYDNIEKEIENKNMPVHEIKLPKTIMQSPSMVKVPLLCATPITAGMEMYNYLKQKSWKLGQCHNQERCIDKKVNFYIDQVFSLEKKNFDQKGKEIKKQMIIPLYKISSEEYLASNQHEKDTPSLLKGFLALSIELVFFVSNITLTFQEIEDCLQIDPYEMWKVVDYFLKSDKSIPSPLKLHLLDLEVNLISFKIWEKKGVVKMIQSIANKSCNKSKKSPEYIQGEKLFKRLLHQIAFQITRLTNLLSIKEETAEFIFDTMKEIITSSIELMCNRHIDQLIICSIFANCKVDKFEIKFNEIKEQYEESNPNLKGIVQDIICNVFIKEGEPLKDVIKFYNEVYIKTEVVKKYILELRQEGNNHVKKNTNTLLMSPMKAIIPHQPNRRNKLKGNMTPNTELLVAINESPFLKYQHTQYKGAEKSRKVLNYEEAEENIAKMAPTKGTQEIETETITNNYVKNKFSGAGNSRRQTLKQNQNTGPSLNSHRSIYDATDKKQPYLQPTHNINGDETRQRERKPFNFAGLRHDH